MLGIHGHAHACVHMGMSHFIPHHVQKVARLSAVQGRTTDIAGHDSLACGYTFVAHLKPEHLMVHPKLVLGNHIVRQGGVGGSVHVYPAYFTQEYLWCFCRL